MKTILFKAAIIGVAVYLVPRVLPDSYKANDDSGFKTVGAEALAAALLLHFLHK